MPKKQYSKSKIQRDHELNIALLQAMGNDPSLKYFIGASVGMGAVWLQALLGKDRAAQIAEPSPVNWYETLLGVGSPLLSASGIFDFNKDGQGGLAGDMLAFGTASYTGFCVVNCILSSASGNESNPLGALAALL